MTIRETGISAQSIKLQIGLATIRAGSHILKLRLLRQIAGYGNTLSKPTYYLWKNDFSSQEAFETVKERYRKLGFRVVTYLDGQEDKNIHVGLKAVIQNHYCSFFS